MTDLSTANRTVAATVRQLADQMRQPVSIAFALVRRGLCADLEEAQRLAQLYYPWT